MNQVLLLRLAGPMQSWGTRSGLQLRRTDPYPSKSGVLGLILCAMGVVREDAGSTLEDLVSLRMAVRIDCSGVLDWDYHTVGAGVGIRKAEGGVKKTATTGEFETLLSRRQYLFDASFLVALQGAPAVIEAAATAMRDPVWPVFLGRKCCVPAEPVMVGVTEDEGLLESLAAQPIQSHRPVKEGSKERVGIVMEHQPGSAPPQGARLVYDVPRTLKNPYHGARWVHFTHVEAPLVYKAPPRRSGRTARVDYASEQWKATRRARLDHDAGLCVFCKMPAQEVHHVTYANVGAEQVEDLRSLCKICHDACTQLEYGRGMRQHRVDPADPGQRDDILRQVGRLLHARRQGVRRALLERSRTLGADFLGEAPG